MGVKGVLTLGGEVDIVKNTAGDGGGAASFCARRMVRSLLPIRRGSDRLIHSREE